MLAQDFYALKNKILPVPFFHSSVTKKTASLWATAHRSEPICQDSPATALATSAAKAGAARRVPRHPLGGDPG